MSKRRYVCNCGASADTIGGTLYRCAICGVPRCSRCGNFRWHDDYTCLCSKHFKAYEEVTRRTIAEVKDILERYIVEIENGEIDVKAKAITSIQQAIADVINGRYTERVILHEIRINWDEIEQRHEDAWREELKREKINVTCT